ncbi:hypothetical protein K505DRAFT_338868 [Melanomma pulvis-pyrius CBS 109.77]|uniref:Uncharacterized protein n=1 Tax=Melanomma pulvis-pyrius CBS 109.77 TaxID=1314802 RepID=A0A6A6X872_9PLEO|nr:hypothetical protein K505DRAFT_338868 [Melanomma pulvis-pyrius CBS 109.77]
MADTDLSPASTGWSKEALFSLLAIFVMALCSSISLACKYCIVNRYQWDTRRCCWVKRKAIELDLNLSPISRPSTSSNPNPSSSADTWPWGDMRAVRQHQQETYTSLVRLRRGPRR